MRVLFHILLPLIADPLKSGEAPLHITRCGWNSQDTPGDRHTHSAFAAPPRPTTQATGMSLARAAAKRARRICPRHSHALSRAA